MDDLVQRLSEGDHDVEVTIRPERTRQLLRECVDRGYVHILFTGTRGGTELGVRLDPNLSDVSRVSDLEAEGTARLVGNLTLNGVPVHCIADIDLQTLRGKGHLVPLTPHAG